MNHKFDGLTRDVDFSNLVLPNIKSGLAGITVEEYLKQVNEKDVIVLDASNPGEKIEDRAKLVAEMAEKSGSNVAFVHNGTVLIASPGEEAGALVSKYYNEL